MSVLLFNACCQCALEKTHQHVDNDNAQKCSHNFPNERILE